MKIVQLEKGETADYASAELIKYMKMMSGVEAEIVYEKGANGIVLALMTTLGLPTEDIEDFSEDDAYEINVNGQEGYIAGSNIRSILLGVYAYLKKAGCRFIRPGVNGEYIPKKDLSRLQAQFHKKASYRYRCDCIEGSINYEVVRDLIYWLPKAGYNGYMIQGISPYTWYDRWFSHQGNSYKKAEPLTVKEADAITKKLEKDIKKCGLMFHDVGHGFVFPVYGFYGKADKESFNEELKSHIALINGKRKIMHGGLGYTNLCYSNKDVCKRIEDFFVNYLKEKPYIDYLHVWLADNRNNSCECEECMKSSVTDLYVQLLNQIDRAFTKNNINTKIVFILYNDSCWTPLKARFENPSRFVLLTAIRQNYIEGYTKDDPDIVLPEHIHNHYNVPPNHFPMTMGFLREWSKIFDGDIFFFDYHMYSDHYVDPGYCSIAHRLYRDVKLMKKFGSKGLMNCKSPRTQMPNSYPAYLCGETLFDLQTDEKLVQKDYYTFAYGRDGELVYKYLSNLSELFMSDLLRDTGVQAADEEFDDPNVKIYLKWMNNKEALESFCKIKDVIKDFASTIDNNFSRSTNSCQRRSWEILKMQQPILLQLAEALCDGAAGDMERAQEKCFALIDYLARTEDEYMPELDFLLLVRRLRMMFGITDSIFAPVQ